MLKESGQAGAFVTQELEKKVREILCDFEVNGEGFAETARLILSIVLTHKDLSEAVGYVEKFLPNINAFIRQERYLTRINA
jgi:hypothetical protein